MAPTPGPPTAAAGMQPVAPSSRSSSSGIVLTKLILRALNIALSFIALIVLTTNTLTIVYEGFYDTTTVKLKFNDIISYRYMLFTTLLGLLYSLLQTALTVFHLTTGNRVSNILVYLDFFGDLVLLYALATGAAAGFAVNVDLGRVSQGFGKFLAKGNATASMLFLGSICSAVTLVFSAFGLEHRF